MNKLLRKPLQSAPTEMMGKFEKFNLIENPFPSSPYVNQDSTDQRINGKVYEIEIRKKELEQIENVFLKKSQLNPNHLRLGYIIDESYIGRGNGKSAFLVNLQQYINEDYCLDISNNINKCFAVYVVPEAGGRTKTFLSLVDLIFEAILKSNVIESCLAILRIQSINQLYPNRQLFENMNEEEMISKLSEIEWYKQNQIDYNDIANAILLNPFLQGLPADFPLYRERNRLFLNMTMQKDFEGYYTQMPGRGRERLDFVFSHLVQFFQSAEFNGAFILLDDFERIPEFQSARQKRDFALELRSCIFDGLYTSAKTGFYNLLMVLHAGVPRLISDAWAEAGMENRASFTPRTTSNHLIPFGKLSREHTTLLVKKYLSEYRIDTSNLQGTEPFSEDALSRIGEWSEYNAAKILKMAYDLLEKAALAEGVTTIDEAFVSEAKGVLVGDLERSIPKIENVDSTDLLKKASEG